MYFATLIWSRRGGISYCRVPKVIQWTLEQNSLSSCNRSFVFVPEFGTRKALKFRSSCTSREFTALKYHFKPLFGLQRHTRLLRSICFIYRFSMSIFWWPGYERKPTFGALSTVNLKPWRSCTQRVNRIALIRILFTWRPKHNQFPKCCHFNKLGQQAKFQTMCHTMVEKYQTEVYLEFN